MRFGNFSLIFLNRNFFGDYMFLRCLAFFLAVAISVSTYAMEKVVAFAVSEYGVATALLYGGKYRLIFKNGSTERSYDVQQLNAVADVDPRPTLSWGGKRLAIFFNADEETSVVLIFDTALNKVIYSTPATSFGWIGSGEEIVTVPLYPLDGVQESSGILRTNVVTRKTSVMARGYFFSGEVVSSRDSVLARATKIRSQKRISCLVQVDLASEKTREIWCR